jgi:hypothetical protein
VSTEILLVTNEGGYIEGAQATRSEVIRAALLIKGRSYAAQGRLTRAADGSITGPGVDCIGAMIFLAHETGISSFDCWGYSQEPDGASFEAALDEHCIPLPLDEVKVADLLAFDYGDGIQHCALITELHPVRRDWRRYTIFHSIREHGVHVAPLGWKYSSYLKKAYRVPGVIDG